MVCDLWVSPIIPSVKTLCLASPSLQWVAWTSLPHLLDQILYSDLRYYDPLRLPKVHLRFVRCSLSAPDTLHVQLVCDSKGIPRMTFRLIQGCWTVTLNTGKFWLRLSLNLHCTGKLWALSSSRVTPLNTCPGLGLRWCPPCLSYRSEDCCLPSYIGRRLSLFFSFEKKIGVYPLTTFTFFSELNTGPIFLIQSGSGLPLPGLPSDLPIDLLTKL